MKTSPLILTLSLICPLLPLTLRATGDYWSPPRYLDGQGRELTSAPEFFWDTEIVRIAAKYRDKDSAGMKVSGAASGHGFLRSNPLEEETPADPQAAVKSADLADFADAVKTGRVKPADPLAATAAHAAARDALAAHQPLPGGEADSEFADYHTGAAAPDSAVAAAAWEKLLARPEAERHYRSVWAAYMLGKHALTAREWPGAVARFEECRRLARAGFADSLSLAADSYGWQGRAELMAEHYPIAARLYLTQLALGDPSAAVSLKRLIPEWMSTTSGGLPGEPLPEEGAAPPPAEDPDKLASIGGTRWTGAAKDPVLQELVTAHVLATDTGPWASEAPRCVKWLTVIENAGVEKVSDATRLAWVAYAAGQYPAAKRWLAKADGASPLGLWLKAKFALRDGHFDEAGKLLPEVTAGLPVSAAEWETVTLPEHALGELAALQYARAEFAAAFDSFVRARADDDAQFMIESILTVDELLAAAAKIPRPQPSPDAGYEKRDDSRFSQLRSLIGRRLVREGKVKPARDFLDPAEVTVMDEYIGFVVKAEDKKVPAADRARAWWMAGRIMLDSGHSFRGTEEDAHRPSEEPYDWTVRGQRMAGKFQGEPDYSADVPVKPKPAGVFLPPGSEEKQRLAATAAQHAKATRTRMVAANHLLAAAALLPKGTEDKARILNTAGFWLQDIDNPAADKIYNVIEGELAATPTGKAILLKRWFIGEGPEPWTTP